MKLATFSHQNVPTIGMISSDETLILPLILGESLYFGLTSLPQTMLELIADYDLYKDRLLEIQEKWHKEPDLPLGISLASVELLAPIPRPQKNIFCIGKNYREHVKELSQVFPGDAPEVPIFFSKAPTAVIGPNESIDPHTDITEKVDYEVEVLLVIGKTGRNISKEKAHEHIFGYTILNDVTARDLQAKHIQWLFGKTLDTFAPMGPWIVTADEFPAPEKVHLTTHVNGELRQEGCLKDLIFDIPTLIETLSAGITLEAGDLIATGTPSGVGAGFHPPKFLKSGDRIDLEISGIGKLSNRIK